MSLNDDVAAYSMATSQFLHDAEIVNDDNLDRHVEGGWSARQVIHHIADSEAQSYARLRRLLAEPAGSVIQGYDEAAWAECPQLGYRDLPVVHSLEVFKAVRLASLDVLDGFERSTSSVTANTPNPVATRSRRGSRSTPNIRTRTAHNS